jgi:hypothetical protein
MKESNLTFLKDRQETRAYFSRALDDLIILVYQSDRLGKENAILWPMIAEYFTA